MHISLAAKIFLWIPLIGLCGCVWAEELVPVCPSESAIPRSAPKRIAQPLALPPIVASISYALTGPAIAIDAEYDGSGRLVCASPVAGNSVYWPYAIAMLSRQGATRTRQVLEFDEPGVARRRENNFARERNVAPCSEGTEADIALDLGSKYMALRRLEEAIRCIDIAIRDSDSFASHYIRAILAGLLRDDPTNIKEYRRAIELLPTLYDAELGLLQTQWLSGDLEAANITVRDLAGKNPPLPIRVQMYSTLTYIYDGAKLRDDAAEAAVKHLDAEREVPLRYPDPYSQAKLAFDSRTVAIRHEEIGKYALAARYFAESVKWSYNEKVSEAVRFEADLGRARSLRRIGEVSNASHICGEWRRRISQVGPELNNLHWGGKTIVQARWEFACGDFNKGLGLVQKDMKRHPTDDTPYLVLEEGYRSRGQSDLADPVHGMAERVRSAHDRAVLGSILREADELVKRGDAVTITK